MKKKQVIVLRTRWRPERFIFILLLICICLTPLFMHLLWLLWKPSPLNIVLLDKTVLTKRGHEHASFSWVLINDKYVKRKDRKLYAIRADYKGFFPLNHEEYHIDDFELFNPRQIDSLVEANDMMYITDTYGIYTNEWYSHARITERSKIVYGGMTSQELNLLRGFKAQGKLILTEFNCIASPTKSNIRKDFEQTFGLKWTGWIGRFYDDLDSANKDLPRWLTRNYMKQHNMQWPFRKSGIVFVREDDHIEVLENGKDLLDEVPRIYTASENQENFNIPAIQKYPYWFDIMDITETNKVVSLYKVKPTARGDSIMTKYDILKDFPAVIEHYESDYRFFYFAGDFCDNPISQHLRKFKGIHYFRKLLYRDNSVGDREDFFWEYYRPLVSGILKRYNEELKRSPSRP